MSGALRRLCHGERAIFPKTSSRKRKHNGSKTMNISMTFFQGGDSAGIFLLFIFLLGILGLAGLYAFRRTLLIVGQASVVVLERLGRFHKVCTSGLNFLNPALDRPRKVYWSGMRPGQTVIDLREQFIEPPAQAVITRDNVGVMVDSV